MTLGASLDVIPQPSLDCVRIRSMEHLGSLPLPHMGLKYHRAIVNRLPRRGSMLQHYIDLVEVTSRCRMMMKEKVPMARVHVLWAD